MRITASTVLLAGVSVLAGCGGGSSAGSGGGSLNFRAMWQRGTQPAVAVRAQRQPAAPSGFSPTLPSNVSTIRIVFVADSGFACCSAIDTGQLPVDAAGHSDLVLGTLPAGQAMLTLAGFATDFAPAPAGAARMCPISSGSGAFPCDASRSASPIFASNPQRVLIIAGQDNDAGEILIFAVPGSTDGGGGPCTGVGAPAPPASSGTAPTTAIVIPGESIAEAAKRLPAGSTLFVSPGVYGPVSLQAGDLQGPITLLADVTGTLTESAPAPVTINGRDRVPAIELNGQTGVIVDGFQLLNGRGAGILVQSSSGITVRNCIISSTRGDGIQVEETDQTLVFNNLVTGNSGTGVGLRCTSSLRLINNTLYNNDASGITIGQSQPTLAENNIIDHNSPLGIAVDSQSITGYQGNFNLNTDGYGVGTPIGTRDLRNVDPLFIAPTLGDFHLARGENGSTSPAVDAGTFDTPADLVDALGERTTQTNAAPDRPPVDLGYHYLPSLSPTPTPVI